MMLTPFLSLFNTMNYLTDDIEFALSEQELGYSEGAPVHARYIKHIKFSVLTKEEIIRLSVRPTTRPLNRIVNNSVIDPHLGVFERSWVCETCGLGPVECVGHPSHILLPCPVFHPGLFGAVLRIARTICKACGGVLLRGEEKRRWLRQLLAGPAGRVVRAVAQQARRVRICPACGAGNGAVRRVRPLGLDAGGGRISPLELLGLLGRVPRGDRPLLGLRAGQAPGDLLLSALPVAALAARPYAGGLTRVGAALPNTAANAALLAAKSDAPLAAIDHIATQDDLTQLYNDIAASCEGLRSARLEGTSAARRAELADTLQMHVARLMDSTLPGYPASAKGHPLKAFAQRLKGKHGRFRGNLSGKRVNFSCRSVISPDPSIDIDEVAVPLTVAKHLTYPERVHRQNIEFLKALVRTGQTAIRVLALSFSKITLEST